MPGFTTHYLFGITSYKTLNHSGFKRNLKKNHAAFSLGLQGPDIFFYDVPAYLIHRSNIIASTAHCKHTGQFLSALLESRNLFPEPEDRAIAEAYIAGFIGHYTLDATCHPYVYAISKNRKDDPSTFGAHVYLEVDIDTAFLRHYKELLPSRFYQERTICLNKKQRHVIASILHFCYKKTYPDLRLGYATAYAATICTPLGCAFFHDNTGQKKALFRKLENIYPGYAFISPLTPSDTLVFFKDALNLNHKKWKNPWDESLVSTASFPELFHSAGLAYQSYLNDLSELFSLTCSVTAQKYTDTILKKLGNKSYHSGLDCERLQD